MISIKQAIQAAEQLPKTKHYLRWSESELQPGETLSPSWVWVEGEPTSKRLPGTCALDPHYNYGWLADHSGYFGDLYLVTGCVIRRGNDPGEVILRNTIVVKKLLNEEVR